MTMGEDRFVGQVRRVCDYLVASGSPHASELEDTLKAYADSENDTEQRSELRRVVSKVFPTIEKRTLAAVLSGTFQLGIPKKTGRTARLFAPTNIVAILGLVLIAASLHWSYWSTRASAVIVSLDSVLEIQRNLNIEEIVHTRDLCQYQQVQLDDQDVYRFVLAAREMAYNDKIWLTSQEDAHNLKLGFWPLKPLALSARKTVEGLFGKKDRVLGSQIIGPTSKADGEQEFCDIFVEIEGRTLDEEYRWYQASFADLAKTIPLYSGSELFRGTGTATIEVLKKNLTEYQVVVHRWILPTLHGALGAVLFCLVRAIREPFLVPFTPRDIMLRLFFGAFVGYLVSALFVPSGVLGQANSGAAPIASIASFVFGYSIDSFIGLLNRMNSYIVELPDQKDSKGR